MLSQSLAARILSKFTYNFSYAFAYGSGVTQQTGYSKSDLKNSLFDLVFCVNDPLIWHTENIKLNPSHYSFMRYFDAKTIAKFQTNYGAKVYCNTLIPIENDCSIKYGVISTNDLCNDLNDWTDLYIAGRLHKPITTLIRPNSDIIRNALETNHINAIRTALILLPAEFTYFELFYEIAQLSYNGDFRMTFGENKEKVRNIVEPQMESFFKLYSPHLKVFEEILQLPNGNELSDNSLKQDKSENIIREQFIKLPQNVRNKFNDVKECNDTTKMQLNLRKSLANIVNQSSKSQSLKNIPTAGLTKAIKYSWKKVLKTFS